MLPVWRSLNPKSWIDRTSTRSPPREGRRQGWSWAWDCGTGLCGARVAPVLCCCVQA